MINVNQAEAKLKEIHNDILGNLDKIKSEEDSKIQIINRVFNEVLDWPYPDFLAENKHENGFSDYILTLGDSPVLLIEAKRTGIISVSTAIKNKIRHLKISGSSLKTAMDGID